MTRPPFDGNCKKGGSETTPLQKHIETAGAGGSNRKKEDEEGVCQKYIVRILLTLRVNRIDKESNRGYCI